MKAAPRPLAAHASLMGALTGQNENSTHIGTL